MNRNSLRWFLTVLTLLFAIGVPLLADDDTTSRQSLKGIKSIAVVIGPLDSDELTEGLTVDQLQTDVELRLRKAGVSVVTSGPTVVLLVDTNFLKNANTGLYAYYCEVKVLQLVTAPNATSLVAPTWSKSILIMVGSANLSSSVRGRVGDLVDKFLNAYLSVNPK